MNDIQVEFVVSPHTFASSQSDSVSPRKRKVSMLVQQQGSLSPKSPSKQLNHEQLKQLGPIRQYYHSRTNLPISRSKWDKDEDSDDEDDDNWIRQLGERVRNNDIMRCYVFILFTISSDK